MSYVRTAPLTFVKNWWKSKTFWLNVITMVLAVFTLLSEQPFIPPNVLPFVLFAVGVLNLILRLWFTNTATTQPLGLLGKGKG